MKCDNAPDDKPDEDKEPVMECDDAPDDEQDDDKEFFDDLARRGAQAAIHGPV